VSSTSAESPTASVTTPPFATGVSPAPTRPSWSRSCTSAKLEASKPSNPKLLASSRMSAAALPRFTSRWASVTLPPGGAMPPRFG
jgi:hypothetical protein